MIPSILYLEAFHLPHVKMLGGNLPANVMVFYVHSVVGEKQ